MIEDRNLPYLHRNNMLMYCARNLQGSVGKVLPCLGLQEISVFFSTLAPGQRL